MGCGSSNSADKGSTGGPQSPRDNERNLGYPSDTSQDLIQTLRPLVSGSVFVLRLSISELKDVHAGLDLAGFGGPFAEFKLSPPDVSGGDQLQHTSYKPGTTNPIWNPPERFNFVVTDKDSSKITVSVFHHTLNKNKTPIGDGVLYLSSLPVGEKIPKTLSLVSPSTGKAEGKALIEVELVTFSTASMHQIQTAYEFERWEPGLDWGRHYLPTDPGRFCNSTATKFGKELDEVTPNMPPDFVVSKNWYTLSNEWSYASKFHTKTWFAEAEGHTVRRRIWLREVADPSSLPADALSSNQPTTSHRHSIGPGIVTTGKPSDGNAGHRVDNPAELSAASTQSVSVAGEGTEGKKTRVAVNTRRSIDNSGLTSTRSEVKTQALAVSSSDDSRL